MKKKMLWLAASCLVAMALLLGSCTPAATPRTTPTASPTPTTFTPTTFPSGSPTPTSTSSGNWWDKLGMPQYGGTIITSIDSDIPNFDFYLSNAGYMTIKTIWKDSLASYDWTTDRKIYGFKGTFQPIEYATPSLCESWEIPDLQTFIGHVRKGVYWQDKPPVNGREFTAYDVEWYCQRFWGLGSPGSGYTTPSPGNAGTPFMRGWKSVTATDKYTFVIKWDIQSLQNQGYALCPESYMSISPPEAIKLYGNESDWRHCIGTGPWMISDYVSGSSLTFIKNPNYWGYDERYPHNRLPYADNLRILIIPDLSTMLAALRTGKIDLAGAMAAPIDWVQAASLEKTHPEILKATLPVVGVALAMRCDTKPFSDIRIRIAMQMAIDIPTIAKTYYGGNIDEVPCAMLRPDVHPKYCFPYADWPQQLKDEFAYNPAGANKLLAEAGYPNGFKTNIVAPSTYDMGILQVLKAYLLDIGVDMEIRAMDPTAFTAFTRAGKNDQMATGIAVVGYLGDYRSIGQSVSTRPDNTTRNNDPVFDAMCDRISTLLDPEQARLLTIQTDRYIAEHHWHVVLPPRNNYTVYQPWLKGYSGESLYRQTGWWFARFWIDSNLKKAMGH